MIVIALLAIFASIAVPSFTSMIANTRTETTASELHSLLVSARSNAITQRTRTTLTLKANKWELTQGSTVSGTLIIPTGVSLTPSSLASLTFQPDGSTSQATLCLSNNRGSKTFTLDVQPSGVIRLSPSASCS